MKLVRWPALWLGFQTILASGMAFADDVVSIGVLPGSSIVVKGFRLKFGHDPPVRTLDNVSVTDDGTGRGVLSVAKGDIGFKPVDSPTFGHLVTIQLRVQSDAVGEYDRNSGSASARFSAEVKFTSNLPGFDNNNCIIPKTTTNLSTGNPGGSLCSAGDCTAVDNTLVIAAIPTGGCGSSFLGDYANIINQQIGLPSLTSGDNVITLAGRMAPALPP